MIIRLALVIAIAITVWIGWNRFTALPPAQRKRATWQFGTVALAGLLLLLAVSGRLHWLMALAAALVPAIRAALPALARLLPGLLPMFLRHRKARASAVDANDNSTIHTDWLDMSLDHQSGEISGHVRQGSCAGRALDELSEQELYELYRCCADQDADSAQLLAGYLEQRLGKQCQEQFSKQGPSTSAGSMSPDEARAILGVKANATREQILSAHRRLMQKLHPDRGGNDYLAAQLNRARDCLLG